MFRESTLLFYSPRLSHQLRGIAAAGAVEAIATVLAIYHQISPPTINFSEADPDCDLDYVFNTARPMKINTAISNGFGFGGHNASLLFKKYEG